MRSRGSPFSIRSASQSVSTRCSARRVSSQVSWADCSLISGRNSQTRTRSRSGENNCDMVLFCHASDVLDKRLPFLFRLVRLGALTQSVQECGEKGMLSLKSKGLRQCQSRENLAENKRRRPERKVSGLLLL